MTGSGPAWRRWAIVAAVLAVSGIVLASSYAYLRPTSPGPSPNPGPPGSTPYFRVVDMTGSLGPVFHPGVILGAAGNTSAVIAGGIGVYDLPTDFTLPVAAEMRAGTQGPVVTNLTPAVNDVFYNGGVYALGWNGTAWLVGGQSSWGGQKYSFGTAVALQAGKLTNVTPVIGRYFVGGGVFAIGWNGTSWLVGGNSSSGVVLVALTGNTVTNLTPYIRYYYPLGWIQDIFWNGAEWFLGGREVFGTFRGHSYHDLLPGSPFADNGVWTADWNGSVWLAGGGAGKVMVVDHDAAHPGPLLPRGFDQAVLMILHMPHGWLLAGKGSTAAHVWAPELVYWAGGGGPSNATDLTSLVPPSFDVGEIQFGAWAPVFGAASIILVGEGSYNTLTGYGVGAVAVCSFVER